MPTPTQAAFGTLTQPPLPCPLLHRMEERGTTIRNSQHIIQNNLSRQTACIPLPATMGAGRWTEGEGCDVPSPRDIRRRNGSTIAILSTSPAKLGDLVLCHWRTTFSTYIDLSGSTVQANIGRIPTRVRAVAQERRSPILHGSIVLSKPAGSGNGAPGRGQHALTRLTGHLFIRRSAESVAAFRPSSREP